MPGMLPVMFILVLGMGLLNAPLLAQPKDTRPPLPFLNQDGSKPRGFEDKTTFLDPKTGDIMAIYHSIGGEPGAAGNEINVRIQLSRHIRPHVLSAISYDEQSRRFRYSYTLKNDAPARQAAWKWYFDNIDESSVDTVQVPPGWRYSFPVRSVGDFSISEQAKAAVIAFRAMQFYSVNAAGAVRPEQGIHAGEASAGFHVRSSRRPGLIAVLVQGDGAIPAYPDEPPENVTSQVDKVLRSPYNYQHAFAFAPKYEATTDRATVARGLLQDLGVLAGAGEVDPQGEFVASATALLQRLQKENVPATEVELLQHQSKMGMEREFAAAVCWAMNPTPNCAR